MLSAVIIEYYRIRKGLENRMQKRIWELDALRGLCVLGMVIVHLIYDLVELYEIIEWDYPVAYEFLQQWGGVLFLLISGISVTLGRHHIRRGLMVICGGLLCTAVTAGMYFLNFADSGILIYFGVLHCLGFCMLLWHPVRKAPVWLLALLGLALTGIGLWFMTLSGAGTPWLVPFGLTPLGFRSSDYFPLLPHFGFFLLGAVLGKTVYAQKQTLLPKVNAQNPVLRFLQGCGKQSLWIYLLHQPALSGICYLILLCVD